MAANVQAAACLDHASFKGHLGMNPSTERGNNFHVGVHPKEPRIAYPSGKFIVVRNVENPSEVFVYRGHNYPTTVAKFAPNGYWVASADTSGKVRVWSWDNPAHNLKIEIAALGGAIKDLAWDSESKRIVVVGDGSGASVRCVTWDTGNSLGEMIGHNKRVVSCDYRPTRPFRVMSGSEDTRTIFYAGPPFKLDHSNNDQHSNFVNCVRFSPNGELVASCGSDYKLWLYDGKTGEPVKELNASAPEDQRHTGSIYSLAWTADSTHLATAAADKTVKLWDVGTGVCVHTWGFSDAPEVGDMQVALAGLTTAAKPEGYAGYQFASVSLSGDINFLKKGENKPARTVQAHQVSITALCAVPVVAEDGPRVISGSFDGVVCAWNTGSNLAQRVSGQVAGKMHGPSHGNKVSGIALSSAGVVSVGWDDTLRLAPLAEAGATSSYTGSAPTEGQPCDVSASPSSNLVAVATNKGIMLFKGTTQLLYLETSYTPTCIALYNEEDLVVGATDNKIYTYSIKSGGREVIPGKQIDGHRGALKALAFSPDGTYLAAGDAMRMCNVWARGGDWDSVVQGQWVFHTSSITCLAWAPNSQEVATGGQDESIYVWSVAQPRKRINYPFAHKEGVTGVMWLSDDELISAGADHCLARWNVGQDKHKFS